MLNKFKSPNFLSKLLLMPLFLAVFITRLSFASCSLDLTHDKVGIQYIPTIVELLKCTVIPPDNTVIFVSGYKNANDGGGGHFYFDSNSIKPDNGGTIFKLSGVNSTKGRFIRIVGGSRNVLWFGAIGNGIEDDTTAIQKAIDDTPEGGKLIFSPGKYIVSGVVVSKPILLEGEAVSKWFGRGVELVAKGDQRFVLGFISIPRSINGVRLGGEVSHISLNGNGKRFSEAIFVGIGFSEVTLRSLEIGNGIGDGILLRQWYEGKFDDIFVNRVDASDSNAVFFVGSIMQGKRPANVNNLRVYNSRFEANAGVYFKTANDANLDIFTVSNSKFECCYEKNNPDVFFSVFDLSDAYRVQITGNSFTHFNSKRGYSPIFKAGARSGANDVRGVSTRIISNDFIFLDEKTVLTEFSGAGQVLWGGNSLSASIMPSFPFKGNAPLFQGDALIVYPRP